MTTYTIIDIVHDLTGTPLIDQSRGWTRARDRCKKDVCNSGRFIQLLFIFEIFHTFRARLLNYIVPY